MILVRKIHKWTSVIVGVQFLIWLGSGMYFNFMDHTKASGHTYRSHHTVSLAWEKFSLREPQIVLQQEAASTSLALIQLAGDPYYLLNHQRGLYANFVNKYSLIDAVSGDLVDMGSDFAQRLAVLSYTGPGSVISTTFISGHVEDFPKQKNPVWQVNFDDDLDTSVYIESGSGRVVGHIDDDKRLADFLLMLHFMDYTNEGSFNNVQMIVFAFLTLFLCITGLIWTIDLAVRGQYSLKIFARKKTVKLFDRNQKSLGKVTISTHENLLDALVGHDIILPSTCGGGGTCGRCRIMINQKVNYTSADKLHFNEHELEQGYRLACQHFSDDVEQMTLMDITDAKKYKLQLIRSTYLSPFIKELRFKAQAKVPIRYRAGAFMRFFIPAAKGGSIPQDLPTAYQQSWQDVPDTQYQHGDCSRSYSLAGIDEATNELVFVIKMQHASEASMRPGIASNYLCNLSAGDTIEAIGPFEEFYAKDSSDKPLVLVGAGSGMAPLKALIEEQLFLLSSDESKTPRPLHFLYGARNENDVIYVDYFYNLAKKHAHFHYYPVLSQPDEDWLGATGYAQHVLALNWDNITEQGRPEFYLCGPSGLMNDTIKLLNDKGVAEEDIAFDEFTSSAA